MADNAREKFATYERDAEADLDFAQARYYNFRHGRFTSVDPTMASADIINPQTFNRYAYVGNNPVNINDPTGEIWGQSGNTVQWFDTSDALQAAGFTVYNLLSGTVNGQLVALNPNANSYVPVADGYELIKTLGQWGAASAAVTATAEALGLASTVATSAYLSGWAITNHAQSPAACVRGSMCIGNNLGNALFGSQAMANKAHADAELDKMVPPVETEPTPAAPNPEDNKPNTSVNKKPQTPDEHAKKRGGELINQNSEAGQGVGKSGGGGQRYVKAGNQLIQEANKLPKNDPRREAMKKEGTRLINRGKGVNHK